MRCATCGHDNRVDARFCGGCGTELSLTCRACGHANPPASRFCDACGAALVAADRNSPRAYTPPHLAEKILTSRSALEGERKQVTVLFCDIANSTALARRIGAEAMHDLLNAFFDLALAAVHEVEGTVNQFLGDGFMALFGAPVAHEDHVRRALLSALDLRRRLAQAAAGAGSMLADVQVRMGLNTGPVVVGRIGDNLRMDYTAVGDTTNVAARLQSLASPGAICVSAAVHEQGLAHFEFQSLGPQVLKGIAGPVTAYELLRPRARSDADAGRGLGVSSVLVGRDRELARIGAVLQAVRDGHGGILLLSGEPGAGKSRLVTEARRSFGAAPLRWLEGRSLSFGRHLSHWPFREILRRSFGIADDDPESVGWQKLDNGLVALFGLRGRDLLPYIGTVLALPVPADMEDRVRYLDGQGLRRQVFLCMRQLVEGLAQRAPLVMLLEDWHWADQSSVELAEHLLPLAQTAPVLFFFVTRAEPPEPSRQVRDHAATIGLACDPIGLEPLGPGDSARLVGNLVADADLPPSLREQILRRTEGNPFFIEEVIRALVADGVLTRSARDARWQVARDAAQVQLPDTIQGLILARIDRLDEQAKQALKLASVIGRSFFDRVLAAIDDQRESLSERLAALEHAELVRHKQQLPEPEHIFKHALVHEAAYGSILAEQRRAIHGQVAAAIERLFGDRVEEFTSLLAHHFTCAEDWDKAQAYLFRAGDQAGRVAADAEALEHFRRAEQAYTKAHGDRLAPPQRAALARKVGAALYGTGQYEGAHDHMRQALGHLGLRYPSGRWGVRRAILAALAGHVWRRVRRSVGSPAPRALPVETAEEVSTVAHFMAWMDYFLDKERMLLDSLLELQVGERSDFALAEARGLSSLAFGCMTFSARRLSRRIHHEAIGVAQRSGHPSAVAFAWFALAFLDFYDGHWDEFESRMGRAIEAYRETGDIHRWGGAALMLSFVVAHRGDLDRARTLTHDIVRAGRDAADPQVASWGYQNQAYVDIACGPLDAAVDSLRTGQRLAEAIPAWDNLLYQKALCAKALVLRGQIAAAQQELLDARHIIRQAGLRLPYDRIEVLTAIATVQVALAEEAVRRGGAAAGLLAAARRDAGRALRCARQMPLWLPQALRLDGCAAWLSGRTRRALRRWQDSLDAAERAAFPLERGLTLVELGRARRDAAALERALDTFRQAGAATYAALAQAALAEIQADDATRRLMLRQAAEALAAVRADEAARRARDQAAGTTGAAPAASPAATPATLETRA